MGGVVTGVSQCASALVQCWLAWRGASLADPDSLPGQRGMPAVCFLGPSRLSALRGQRKFDYSLHRVHSSQEIRSS